MRRPGVTIVAAAVGVLGLACRTEEAGLGGVGGPADAAQAPDARAASPLPPPVDAQADPPTGPASAQPPACRTNDVHCLGKLPQICGADGRWVNAEACAYACLDGEGCVNRFAAVSSGRGSPTDEAGRAEFAVNGETFFSEGGGLLGARGFNVAVLDPLTGQRLEPVRTFDPWTSPLSGRALEELAAYLEALEPGRLVMIAVSDDAGITPVDACTPHDSAQVSRALAALRRLGSGMIDGYCFRGAWSLVAIAGHGRPLAEKASRGPKITTEVMLPAGP